MVEGQQTVGGKSDAAASGVPRSSHTTEPCWHRYPYGKKWDEMWAKYESNGGSEKPIV